jgi:hypothetical protein
MDGRGCGKSSPGKGEIFLVSSSSSPVLGPTQLPIQWVRGARSSGVKRPGREVEHCPPDSADVKNTLIHISITPYAFMA